MEDFARGTKFLIPLFSKKKCFWRELSSRFSPYSARSEENGWAPGEVQTFLAGPAAIPENK